MEKIIDRLISVKSFVTLLLTVIFSLLALEGTITGEQFLTIFTIVINFYFWNQVEKRAKEENDK